MTCACMCVYARARVCVVCHCLSPPRLARRDDGNGEY